MKLTTRGILSFAGAFAAMLSFVAASNAAIIADWTFETSQPTTAGPFNPEIGAGSGSANTGGGISSPAGNGSAHSFSSNGWDVGDFYQFRVASTGLSGLFLQFDATGSNTGPKDFEVRTSIDNTTYSPLATYAVQFNGGPAPSWNGTTASSAYTYVYALPAALDNQPNAYVRLVNTSTVSINNSTVAAAGTSRVDNVILSQGQVPEPATIVLLGLAGVALFGIGRQMKR